MKLAICQECQLRDHLSMTLSFCHDAAAAIANLPGLSHSHVSYRTFEEASTLPSPEQSMPTSVPQRFDLPSEQKTRLVRWFQIKIGFFGIVFSSL